MNVITVKTAEPQNKEPQNIEGKDTILIVVLSQYYYGQSNSKFKYAIGISNKGQGISYQVVFGLLFLAVLMLVMNIEIS